MDNQAERFTTGFPALDRILKGVLPGDNVVWHVDAIRDYARLIPPYARAAQDQGRPLVYFRFADHPPLARRGRRRRHPHAESRRRLRAVHRPRA